MGWQRWLSRGLFILCFALKRCSRGRGHRVHRWDRSRPVARAGYYDTVMVQPVPVVLAERDIDSVHTQVIIQTYSDRILVIVTQLQKVGTLVRKLCPYYSFSSQTAVDPSLRASDRRPY